MTRIYGHPNKAVFGLGAAADIGAHVGPIGATKALIVTHPILRELGSFGAVEESLRRADISFHIFDDFEENPTDTSVQRGARVYRQEKCDALIAIGGGSAIDCTKAIGILVSNGGSLADYAGMDNFANALPPIIAVPTTSGTGSEVSPYAVITDTGTNTKYSASGWLALPDIALVDPSMMVTMPPSLTASTGMDALSHAIEAIYSTGAMPQTDALALAAIELIAEHLVTAVEDGSNLEAREGMAMAAMMAGSAMCAGCGAVHALGHQLGTEFGMPHGTAMAIMMPYVINFNMSTCVDRLAKVATALGIDTADLDHAQAATAVPFAVRNLTRAVGLPTTLTEYGADPEKIDICAENALKDRNLPDNPIQPSFEEARTLFEDAFIELGSPEYSRSH